MVSHNLVEKNILSKRLPLLLVSTQIILAFLTLLSVWDLPLLKEFTAPEMGVDGDGGSLEKGVRHLARVFKSPISLLHKDQLSSSREGKRGEAPPLVCSHFVPPLFSKERECTVDI